MDTGGEVAKYSEVFISVVNLPLKIAELLITPEQ